MKKWIYTALFALASTCAAEFDNNPFDTNYCGCGFKIGADFLWWKQSVDNLDFGSCTRTSSCTTCNDEYEKTCVTHATATLCPKWKPGVRATIAFTNFLPCAQLRGSYTFIRHRDEGAFCGSPVTSLIPTHRNFEVVCSEWRSEYQAADLLFTFPICGTPCLNAMPFFGLEGVYINHELKSTLSNPFTYSYSDLCSRFHARVWGVGLKLGSDYDYTLNSCLKFFGRGSFSIVAGRPSSTHVFKGDDFTYDTNRIEFCDEGCQSHMMPGFHLQSGFRYLATICRTTVDLHIGYEFVEWLNLPNTKHFVGDLFSDAPLIEATRTNRNLGFNGLFFGVDFSF